jgi:hypothetical protein
MCKWNKSKYFEKEKYNEKLVDVQHWYWHETGIWYNEKAKYMEA